MSTIKVAGEAVVITSSMKFDDLAMIAKYRPDALVLKGGDDGKEPVFSIIVNEGASGSLSKYGATFGTAAYNDDGLAVITMSIRGLEGDIRETISDLFGSAIANLDKLEETLPTVIEEIMAEKAAVMSKITIA